MFEIPAPLVDSIRAAASFPNPERIALERRMKRLRPGTRAHQAAAWTLGRTPKELCLCEERGGRWYAPRGLRARTGSLAPYSCAVAAMPAGRDMVTLRPYQGDAFRLANLSHEAIVSAPTGAGKTAIGLHMIDSMRVPTVVVVPGLALLEQWYYHLTKHWPVETVGRVGGGKCELGRGITVGTALSLGKVADRINLAGGVLVLDECHHAMAESWRALLRSWGGVVHRLWGLTATPWRNGLDRRALEVLIGQVVEVRRDDVMEAGGICKFEVHPVPTGYLGTVDARDHYSAAVSCLCQDMDRNARTVDVVHHAAWDGNGVVMVLSDRVSHATEIAQAIGVDRCGLLVGSMPQGARAEALRRGVAAGIVVATSGILSEGFDLPQASDLVLATPLRFDGLLIQRVGRVLRPAAGKAVARVWDLVDDGPVFRSQWSARRRAYRSVGGVVK